MTPSFQEDARQRFDDEFEEARSFDALQSTVRRTSDAVMQESVDELHDEFNVSPSPPPDTNEEEIGVLAAGATDDADGIATEALLVTAYTQAKQGAREGTAKKYEPKQREWYGFCDYERHAVAEDERYCPDPEYFFRFMFYQLYRSKRSSKRRQNGIKFDVNDYKAVISAYAGLHNHGSTVPDPDNPIGSQQFQSYRSAIKEVYDLYVDRLPTGQRAEYTWGEIAHTRKVQNLFKIISQRKNRMFRSKGLERVNDTVQMFQAKDTKSKIEAMFWKSGYGDDSTATTRQSRQRQAQRDARKSLEHRFTFNMTNQGLVRGESIFLGDLADVSGFHLKRRMDIIPMFVLMMTLWTGTYNRKQ